MRLGPLEKATLPDRASPKSCRDLTAALDPGEVVLAATRVVLQRDRARVQRNPVPYLDSPLLLLARCA